MKPALTAVVALLLALAAATAAAARPRASIAVTPTTVHRGHVVLLHGSAGDCPEGDSVTLMSRAFRRAHEFAGIPAVFARVGRHHLYSARTTIPATKRTGRYVVTARCGGGTFSVSAHLTVVR